MIQTNFWEEPEEPRGSLQLGKLYPRRYIHHETGAVLEKSHYIRNGKRTSGRHEFFVNNKWIQEDEVPERREWRKKRYSSLRGSFKNIKGLIKEKEKKAGKFLIGEDEFKDKWNCYDKLWAQYNEQVERYGDKCPITGQEFTHIRILNKGKKWDRRKHNIIRTNMSPDRLLNHIHYTKQNVLFTSAGWNVARGDLKTIADMKFYLNKNHVERYVEILMERFPDYKEEAQK